MLGQILTPETTVVRYGCPGVRAQLLGCYSLGTILDAEMWCVALATPFF